ncbi:hypothetical protein [Amycolatopsis sp. NPDC098790]
MSQYFSIHDRCVGNPSNGPGTLFTCLAEAFVPSAGYEGAMPV